MSGYERIPAIETEQRIEQVSAPSSAELSGSLSTDTSVPGAFQATASSNEAPISNDGVFSNLISKPDQPPTTSKAFEEIEPPSYADLEPREQIPSYYETTVVASGVLGDGEVLIDGMPVGDNFTLIINMLISMSFDFIGFMLTAMLATSHAARAGSRIGFGITLIRYGLYFGSPADGDLDDHTDPAAPHPGPSEVESENDWFSYFMIFLGCMFLMASNAEYLRAKRLEAVVKASSEIAPA
ncbi:hypothetical protein BC832DRAFT_267639 [Gaertneriomyces semiglobifer]|nr:hypothetical protein BC832DRAFT_267639 [Gaertneriomyces semiglobifer]